MYSWGEIVSFGPAAEAAKQLVIRVKRGKISVLIRTDSISLSLAAEGAMHE